MEIKQTAYKLTGKSISNYDLMKQLPDLKEDFEWIKDVPSQTLQSSLDRLERSYQKKFRSFKKGGGYQKFASKKHPNHSYLSQFLSTVILPLFRN